MVIRIVRRHVLPVCCTAALIPAAWLVTGLPIIAVCVLDNAPLGSLSEVLKVIGYIIGIGAGISAGIMFPVALALERMVARAKPLAVVAPVGLIAISILCLLGCFLWTGEFFDTVFGWAGLLFAFSVVFAFYRAVLWFGRALACGALRVVPSAFTTLLDGIKARWFAA